MEEEVILKLIPYCDLLIFFTLKESVGLNSF